MPRDYKHRADPRPQERRQKPCWQWFTIGLLVGLFTAGLAWLKLGAAPPGGKLLGKAQQHPTGANETSRLPPTPKFDFYTILPEMEVVIPEEEIEPPSPPPKTAKEPPPQPTAGESYILQTGSFRSHSDADRMRARLALLGIEAEIQKVTINNKDTFHRVRSGPYRGREQLARIRDRLSENQISSLVIRLKP